MMSTPLGGSDTKREEKIRLIKRNAFSKFVPRRGVSRRFVLICFFITIIILIALFLELTADYKVINPYDILKRQSSRQSKRMLEDMQRNFRFMLNVTHAPIEVDNTTINNQCEVIHIGFVCSGFKSNIYIHTLMKSILFYRKNPLYLHFLVNKQSELILSTLFDTWNIPQVNVSFYDFNDYLQDVRWVPNVHYSGVYGLYKLLFPKILPKSVDRIIVLDTDLVLVSDIYDLWENFEKFQFPQAIGLVENESDFYLKRNRKNLWPAIGKGFNTGVILYKMELLRSIVWDKLWSQVAKTAALQYGSTSLGDQDIMNTVLKQNPQLLYQIPCNWNIQLSDHATSDECYLRNRMKLIHWNSPKKFNVVNKDSEYFKSIYRTFIEINGDLVGNVLNACTNATFDSTDGESKPVCDEFIKARTGKWRTLLFFREFYYVPNAVTHDVTFLAQLSYDRLQLIEDLVRHWEGPISLTLYASDSEFKQACEFIESSEVLQYRNNIAYHVVFKKGNYHPINLLRNVGLKNLATPYVFLADVDFLPMFGLYQVIRETLKVFGNLNKKALIVPAFETQRYRSRFPKNKHELLEMLDNRAIFTFRYDVWASGHAPTNYSKWRTAQAPYTVKWEPDFEPYIVVRKDVVEYNTSFMGFGWNKVSHIMELECQSYEFIVLHNSFIIHSPHSPSYDIAKFRKSPTYRMCLQFLKEQFVSNLKKKYGRDFDNEKKLHSFEHIIKE